MPPLRKLYEKSTACGRGSTTDSGKAAMSARPLVSSPMTPAGWKAGSRVS